MNQSRQVNFDRADPDKLDSWLRSVLPRALAFAMTLVKDHHIAEDLVHDCCCRLLEKKAEYNLLEDGWRILTRSIVNASIDLARRTKNVSLDIGDDAGSTQGAAVEDYREPAPIENIMHQELEIDVGRALARLPILQRAAVELRSLGFSLTEIGGSLQVTETNAGVLVHRGRAALATYLKNWLEAETRD